jgi:hypothetical protein
MNIMVAQKNMSKMVCSICKMIGHNKKTCTMDKVSSCHDAAVSASVPKTKKTKKTKIEVDLEKLKQPDAYTSDILRRRFRRFKEDHDELCEIKASTGLPIRHQNPPEDITENIAKFVIQNHDNDSSCKWAKSVGLNGDLCSEKYPIEFPPEVKAFTSDGPLSFGPDKKFGAIYFVNMMDLFKNDNLIVWKANLTSESPEWKQTKMNKAQTFDDQCVQGRRPHISWFSLYPQISEHCVKVYEGTFEGIFTASASPITTTVTEDAEQFQSTASQ